MNRYTQNQVVPYLIRPFGKSAVLLHESPMCTGYQKDPNLVLTYNYLNDK